MKKILLVLFVFAAALCQAQKSVKLKMGYQPNHLYSVQQNNVINMVMDAMMDSASKAQLEATGMKFPMEISVTKDMTSLVKTGAANDKKEIPFTMEFTQFTISQRMGGNELPGGENPLKGLKATGWSGQEGKLRIESVEGTAMTEEVKKIMMSTFDQVGTQIKFPEKALKVGDEFIHEVPLELTVSAGVNMNMLVKTTYKLLSFTKESAFFDTIIEMRMDMALDMSEEKGLVNSKGTGTGKVTFDIKNEYISNSTSNLDMVMKMQSGPMDMDIKANTKSETKVSHL